VDECVNENGNSIDNELQLLEGIHLLQKIQLVILHTLQKEIMFNIANILQLLKL
jgi:hypothetical protein